jgi:hypothetical protein
MSYWESPAATGILRGVLLKWTDDEKGPRRIRVRIEAVSEERPALTGTETLAEEISNHRREGSAFDVDQRCWINAGGIDRVGNRGRKSPGQQRAIWVPGIGYNRPGWIASSGDVSWTSSKSSTVTTKETSGGGHEEKTNRSPSTYWNLYIPACSLDRLVG